jgi:hypothetical protein
MEVFLWIFLGFIAFLFIVPWIDVPIKAYWRWCEDVKQKRGW